MNARRLCLTISPLLLALTFFAVSAAAQERVRTVDSLLPSVFEKTAPESVQDLKEIQMHVRTLLDRTMKATVGLRMGANQGSGVIVTKDGFVLTAGHVSGKPGRDCQVILPDGRILKGKTLGANNGIDSGMIKIIDEGEFPYVPLAKSADLKKGQWCLAIGHPGGWQKGRAPVVRLGRIQENSKTFVRSDCALVGGDSGGPLFDMQGRIIGIHSRIGVSIATNIHVPVDTYHETWDKLAKGEEWGGNLLGFGKGKGKDGDGWLGVRLDTDGKNCRITNVTPDSPAAKAGLMAEDVILSLNSQLVGDSEDFSKLIGSKRAGNEITLRIQRGDETLTLKIKLAKRPG
ncbi:MAG: S1C family serine protease [Gemmataceae bacterium]|nr:S1C family serine protease [Gemmataceae bacterium]MCI0741341.1 S1C family serine protease [Gemmataceae bacterium]